MDGINAAFLAVRAILPLALNEGRLVCAVADPTDIDAQAAMFFASGREVTVVAATREAILAALDSSAPHASVPSRPRRGVRNADAVLRLRRHLVEATEQGADALRIDREVGRLTMEWPGGVTSVIDTEPHDVVALVEATNALTVPDDATGFAFSVAGRRLRAWIEVTQTGCLIRFGPQAGREDE